MPDEEHELETQKFNLKDMQRIDLNKLKMVACKVTPHSSGKTTSITCYGLKNHIWEFEGEEGKRQFILHGRKEFDTFLYDAKTNMLYLDASIDEADEDVFAYDGYADDAEREGNMGDD